MAGSAIRRFNTKNSAKPQAATAANKLPNFAPPIQLNELSNNRLAMTTKMSLKPEIRRKCSSSATSLDALLALLAWAFSALAVASSKMPALMAD